MVTNVEQNTRRAKVLSVLILIIASACIVRAQRHDADIRVLQSDEQSIVVEYVPVFLPETPETLKGMFCIRENVDGTMTDESLKPGMPEIPMRATTLRLTGTTNTVELLSADYEDVQGVSLTPVPEIMKSDVGTSRTYTANSLEYGKTTLVPGELVSLGNVGETRGVILGTIYFHPFQY